MEDARLERIFGGFPWRRLRRRWRQFLSAWRCPRWLVPPSHPPPMSSAFFLSLIPCLFFSLAYCGFLHVLFVFFLSYHTFFFLPLPPPTHTLFLQRIGLLVPFRLDVSPCYPTCRSSFRDFIHITIRSITSLPPKLRLSLVLAFHLAYVTSLPQPSLAAVVFPWTIRPRRGLTCGPVWQVCYVMNGGIAERVPLIGRHVSLEVGGGSLSCVYLFISTCLFVFVHVCISA